MSSVAQFIHRAVIKARAEEFFVHVRKRANVIRKFIPISLRNKFPSIGRFIPNASEYPTSDRYFLTRDNTHFKINRSDYVQWRLFYGVRDNALLEAKKYLETGSVVLDIGGSFGAFSLRLATYAKSKGVFAQIHAFEPNPVVFENYKTNLELNPDITAFIHIHPTGLGNENGERLFEYPQSNTGAGRVMQDSQRNLKVTIQRLDDFINVLNPTKIAFIKLIVEGFEPEVFKGGWNTISKYKPPIFFEVTEAWWKENNASIEEVLNKLRALGYHFMIEHYNEMLPYEPSTFSSRTQFNLMATI